jgi:hypothetical protein
MAKERLMRVYDMQRLTVVGVIGGLPERGVRALLSAALTSILQALE